MNPSEPSDRTQFLARTELRAGLERFVRGKAPASEVDDIVQATLADALSARNAPAEATELQRWVYGIARNKVVDFYRKNKREVVEEPALADEIAAESAPLSARELLRWAEQELPEGDHAKNTLEMMLREGSGEKLEEIASEQALPAPRVRQRVARMRRHFRERWAAHLAAIAVFALLVGGAYVIWRRAEPTPPEIVKETPRLPTPEERADELRRAALEDCDHGNHQKCLEGLDRAKALDPRGDEAERIQNAREAAGKALNPAPLELQQAPEQEQAPEESKKKGGRTAPPPAPIPIDDAKPVKGTELAPKPNSEPPLQQKATVPRTAKGAKGMKGGKAAASDSLEWQDEKEFKSGK
jgi:DNA-directed RNA polymerase specialized sigma24 family protein